MRASPSILCVCAVLTITPLAVPATTPSPKAIIVTIPDANLEAAVRSTLGKPNGDIYDTDMAALTYLHIFDKNIADLRGLEYAVSLNSIFIRGGSISDLSPISGLTSLTTLGLQSQSISDMGPISGLTNLTDLDLNFNAITDISTVSALTNLTFLSLDHNSITDISPLAGLTNLTWLQITVNGLSDISPLSGLTNLTNLNLWLNQISDVSPIADLTNLTFLYFSDNEISDIGPIAGLTNLTQVFLKGNHITDVSPLSGLTGLTDLYLGENNITDVSPLASLTNLSLLWMQENAIRDIRPLQGLTNLESLVLRKNDLCDISALVANPGLGPGDVMNLTVNPFKQRAYCVDIPALQARGVTVTYSGTCHGGHSLGELDPDATAHDFGNWDINAGPAPARTLTLSNTGTETLTVFGMSLIGPDAGEFAIPGAPGEFCIRPGEEMPVEVVYDPQKAGDSVATLQIVSDDLDEATIEIALTGAGQAPELPATTAVGQIVLVVVLARAAWRYLFRKFDRKVEAA